MRKLIFLLIMFPFTTGKAQTQTKEPLILRFNSDSMYAYYDHAGKKILGDYYRAFTDTIIDFGIVSDSGFILIDRNGRHIYEIYPFDNGPDYTSDGLYRIIKNGKIGYVDSISSKLIIDPIFNCAYPFEKGKAKVSLKCVTVQEGEHSRWESDDWFYIDKKGNKIK
jgi:hypothetical protein